MSIKCTSYTNKLKIPVILDGGRWKPQFHELLKIADAIICSEDFYPPGCKSTRDVELFLQNSMVKNYAITRGYKSIIVFTKGKRSEIEIKKSLVKDTLGAGDFFHGAFCYYYLISGDFRKAISEAAELASFTCLHEGTRAWINVKK